jgi:hypothetical protein
MGARDVNGGGDGAPDRETLVTSFAMDLGVCVRSGQGRSGYGSGVLGNGLVVGEVYH